MCSAVSPPFPVDSAEVAVVVIKIEFQIPSAFANVSRPASDFALQASTDKMADKNSRFQRRGSDL